MSKARDIVSNALTFRLNRLSPGETLDADTAALCLAALNEVIDQFNGLGSFLTREILTPGVCNGVSGTLGTTWPGLAYGDTILGATVSYAVGLDNPIDMLTMEQYQGIAQKATASIPLFYAPDGGALVYLWPAAVGQTVTLRTKQTFSKFADLDTDYVMPDGFPSALSALVAELLAPSMVGGVSTDVARAATGARTRLGAQSINPAIVDSTRGGGRYNPYSNTYGTR